MMGHVITHMMAHVMKPNQWRVKSLPRTPAWEAFAIYVARERYVKSTDFNIHEGEMEE